MVVALGKRKRQGEVFKTSRKAASKPTPKTDIIEEESESDNEDLQAAFRRAFEAKFKPLDGAAKKKAEAIKAIEEEEDDEEESDFGGLSGAEDDDDDDEDDEVEVIELADIKRTPREELDKKQMKAFMSAKPPTAAPVSSAQTISDIFALKGQKDTSNDGPKTEDDGTDAANLKNDLALQRLLNESHLLDSSFSSTDPSGKNRHKATDMRLLALGSKGSILEQKNMPLSHRKGINAKKATKEQERRSEAKENGIILERAAMQKKTGPKPQQRSRGIGGPSVGKFSGGTLRLSKQDVAGITGPKRSTTKGGRDGKGGRGGRGGKMGNF